MTLDNAAGSATISDSGGNHTIAVPIWLGSNLSVTTTVGSTLTVSGPIGEVNAGATLNVSGGGTLVLSSSNTYTGGTTVNGGTLVLNYDHDDDGTPTIRGVLNINPGAIVVLNVNDAVGYLSRGPDVTTVNIVGGTITSNGINAYTTNFNLTGGTIASNYNSQYDFTNGYGITTYASTATSLISAPIESRDGNNLTFNVARGTTPSGVDLLVSGQLNTWYGNSPFTKTGAGLMEITSAGKTTGRRTSPAGRCNWATACSTMALCPATLSTTPP